MREIRALMSRVETIDAAAGYVIDSAQMNSPARPSNKALLNLTIALSEKGAT